MAKKVASKSQPQEKDKRKYVNQSLVPIHTLEEALRVPKTIEDNFGGQPTAPFQVAMALDTTQTSSYWRQVSGSAVAYGLTNGGYNSNKIGLNELAIRISSPTQDGAERPALVEAALRPTVLQQFFSKYNNSKFPKDNIAENVLKIEFNIPAGDTRRVLELIQANGKYVGIIHETKTGPYVFMDEPANVKGRTEEDEQTTERATNGGKSDDTNGQELPDELLRRMNLKKTETVISESSKAKEKPRVFISHGKNKKIVEQLKEILTFGQFDVTISIEKETTAVSVPEKVFSDMSNCDAAVIHVEGERELFDKDGNAHYVINENVLIEIGAAIALYGKKFVLLCEKSLNLPSNLQGLYRCNYEGKELNYEATMKLQKAFNEFRNS